MSSSGCGKCSFSACANCMFKEYGNKGNFYLVKYHNIQQVVFIVDSALIEFTELTNYSQYFTAIHKPKNIENIKFWTQSDLIFHNFGLNLFDFEKKIKLFKK